MYGTTGLACKPSSPTISRLDCVICILQEGIEYSLDFRKEQNHGERHANLLELATLSDRATLCIHGAVAVRHRRQFTVHSPSILPSAHVVGARVLLKPKNYPLEHSKQRRARWWPKRFRCINRWCSEKPKKTHQE